MGLALGRYPKKQVLDDPVHVKMIRDRVEAMRKAAGQLSTAQKKKIDVPWDTVEAEADETPDALSAMGQEGHPEADRRNAAGRQRHARGGLLDLSREEDADEEEGRDQT